jgi:hypothetical protein
MDQLFARAMLGRLVRTPSREACAVAKPAGGDLIVDHFDDQLVAQRDMNPRDAAMPPAGTTGRIAGEARRAFRGFEQRREPGALLRREDRGEADMIQPGPLSRAAERSRARTGNEIARGCRSRRLETQRAEFHRIFARITAEVEAAFHRAVAGDIIDDGGAGLDDGAFRFQLAFDFDCGRRPA